MEAHYGPVFVRDLGEGAVERGRILEEVEMTQYGQGWEGSGWKVLELAEELFAYEVRE